MIPRALMFDLDNTLAISKQAIAPDMAEILERLLEHTSIAIISGGSFEQLRVQAAEQLAPNAPLEHFYLFPTSGAALYSFAGDALNPAWDVVYEERLTDEEAADIIAQVQIGVAATGLIDLTQEQYGPYIENRGAQISLSALGQRAPVTAKEEWDPTGEKRKGLQAAIAPLLPEFDVKVGGLTTIDITKHGINKAYGVRKFSEYLDVPITDMLYIGDALFEGGNDAVVTETGIPTRSVADPHETAMFLESLLRA